MSKLPRADADNTARALPNRSNTAAEAVARAAVTAAETIAAEAAAAVAAEAQATAEAALQAASAAAARAVVKADHVAADAALAAVAVATETLMASAVGLPSPRLATDSRLVQDIADGQLAARTRTVAADAAAALAASDAAMVAVTKVAAAVTAAASAAAEAVAEAAALVAAQVAKDSTSAALMLSRDTSAAHESEKVDVRLDDGSGETPASTRDLAAVARDEAADARDAAPHRGNDERRAAGDRAAAATDRAAAASDRFEAASDRHAAEDALQVAYRDELTGVLLRAAGHEQMDQAIDHASRSNEPLAFAFLDVDSLKKVNDTGGHAAGDLLLHELGVALRHHLRSYDIVVRHGGDEFVCALAGSQLSDAGLRLAEVSALLSQALDGATFSFGLAKWQPGETADDVIARADADLYARRSTREAPGEEGGSPVGSRRGQRADFWGERG